MSNFPRRRRERQIADREYMQAARVTQNDPEASLFAGGNVYSRADIEALEREKTAFWRRKRKRDGH
jgi:hypothetical protein